MQSFEDPLDAHARRQQGFSVIRVVSGSTVHVATSGRIFTNSVVSTTTLAGFAELAKRLYVGHPEEHPIRPTANVAVGR